MAIFTSQRRSTPPGRAAFCAALFCAALALAQPGHTPAREAGWVPLEKSRGLARQEPPQSGATVSGGKSARTRQKPVAAARAKGSSVYDGQPPVTESELYEFVELLPRFRAWTRSRGEEAHPVLNKEGRPDFIYSAAAAEWVRQNGFEPARFFCVMGRMAAALVIVEEGNDGEGVRPADMPSVDAGELALARKHLGELLSAGGQPRPIK